MIEPAISKQPLLSQRSYRYDDDLASGMDATERLAYQRRQLRERLGLADRPEAASKALREEEALLNSAFRPRPHPRPRLRPRPTQMQAAAAHARACRLYHEYCMCLADPYPTLGALGDVARRATHTRLHLPACPAVWFTCHNLRGDTTARERPNAARPRPQP